MRTLNRMETSYKRQKPEITAEEAYRLLLEYQMAAEVSWLMTPRPPIPVQLLRRPAWMARAACIGIGTEVFFVEKGGSLRRAREICAGCAVRQPCLDYAMAEGQDGVPVTGFWGGTTGKERRELKRHAS